MANKKPKPIPKHLRGVKPTISGDENDPTVQFIVNMPWSTREAVKGKGGAVFVRKAIRETLEREGS